MGERRVAGFRENRMQRAIRVWMDGADVDGLDLNASLEATKRQEILSAKVYSLVRQGYQIQQSDEFSASLVNPAASPMGIGSFVAGVLTLGLAWVFTPMRRGKENDRHMYIEVKPNGVVESTGLFGTTQDYSGVPIQKGK